MPTMTEILLNDDWKGRSLSIWHYVFSSASDAAESEFCGSAEITRNFSSLNREEDEFPECPLLLTQ